MQKIIKHKKRIKYALKIMRESSGGKFEIMRDIYGIDPSHIESGESVPTLNTIMSYCHLFDRCPGWLLLLSCQVEKGNLSEKEFEGMILKWEKIENLADLNIDLFIKAVRSALS